jgi:hypothetical protein
VALPVLDPDHLTVFVFGPGLGELILVRVPPDVWMVVDGCASGDGYAQRVLDRYQARPQLVVLTHPHEDHSKGLADVIVRATPRDRKNEWPRIGMVLPPGGGGTGRSDEYIAGITEQVISAVEARWREFPACKWEMLVGDVERLGEATVRVLSPEAAVRATQLALWSNGERFDHNVISSALLLEWKGRRVVLGSDLVEVPRNGWISHAVPPISAVLFDFARTLFRFDDPVQVIRDIATGHGRPDIAADAVDLAGLLNEAHLHPEVIALWEQGDLSEAGHLAVAAPRTASRCALVQGARPRRLALRWRSNGPERHALKSRAWRRRCSICRRRTWPGEETRKHPPPSKDAHAAQPSRLQVRQMQGPDPSGAVGALVSRLWTRRAPVHRRGASASVAQTTRPERGPPRRVRRRSTKATAASRHRPGVPLRGSDEPKASKPDLQSTNLLLKLLILRLQRLDPPPELFGLLLRRRKLGQPRRELRHRGLQLLHPP